MSSKKKSTAVDMVFNALMDRVARYEFMPGDRLPSESDIAEEYGVSRVTVRSALNMLSTLSVIETRVGGGSYVKHFRFSDITNSASKMMLNQVTTKDVNEYRALIEIAALELLKGKRILSKDIKYLEKCCVKMENASNNNDLAQADYDFHLWICRMSGNIMFVYSYDMIRSIMGAYFTAHYSANGSSNSSAGKFDAAEAKQVGIDIHKTIVKYISEGKIDEAIEINRVITRNDDGFLIE